MASSLDAEQRKEAVRLLRWKFGSLEDIDAAWNVLISLAGNEDDIVRVLAIETLGIAFHYIADKEAAWKICTV